MRLTKKELREWLGTPIKKRQIEWLHNNGVIFRIDAVDEIIVDDEHYKQFMGVTLNQKEDRQKTAPDFDSLRRLQHNYAHA